MKILNIIQRYPPAIGGSEKWCEDICEYLSRRGYFVKILTTDIYNISEFYLKPKPADIHFKFGRLEYKENISVRRCRILRLGSFFHWFFKRGAFKNTIFSIFIHSPISLEMYLEMFREIRTSDIVHLHTIPYFHNLIGFSIAKIFGKQIIITPHFHPGHPLYENKLFYRLMNHCNAILTVTEYEKNYFIKRGIKEDKIYNIGNCIYPGLYQPRGDLVYYKNKLLEKYNLGNKTRIIIFIGARNESKGWNILIPVVKQLIEEKEDLCLFFIGPSIEAFDRYYSSLSESDRERIIDLGCVSHQEKVNLLHISDLLVLPSAFEAFGIVFLEAWICNKPVIGTERGAMPDVIGDAGLISNYGDVDELKEKIKTILKDESFARELAERGRKKTIEHYTWEKIGEKVFNLYNTINKKYRKKILIVSHLFPPYFLGGSEIVSFEQAKILKTMGHEVKVFCGGLNPRAERFALSSERGIFEVARVNLDYNDFKQRNYANYDKEKLQSNFKEILYRYSPDIVHFHNIYALSAKMVDVCAEFNIPTIMTLHDYWGICVKNIMVNNKEIICAKNGMECINCQQAIELEGGRRIPLPVRNYLLKNSLNKVRKFISPSKYLSERFIASGFPREKFSLINNGIKINRFHKPKQKKSAKIIFAYIGHFVQHKGIDRVIEAVSLLEDKQREKMLFYLVGDGEKQLLSYYKSLIGRFSLGNIVKILGRVNNSQIPNIYRQIDVLILPALWPENSPVTIMEALASKTPVLASNLGGIGELVEDGVNGLLSDHNDPQSLKANMERIINNPSLIEKMGEEGFKKVKKYDLKNQVKLIEEEYLRLMNLSESIDEVPKLIVYQGELDNLYTQKLFDYFRKYENNIGCPINICLSDLLEESVFAKAKILVVPHYENGIEEEIERARRYKIPVFVNKDDEQLKDFSFDSDKIFRYNDDYSQFHHKLNLIYK